MLSWKRVDKLFDSLDNYVNMTYLPLNLILRVQGNEELNNAVRKKIERKCKKFKSYKLYFTNGNEGTARPRKKLFEQILKYYPDTVYFNLADDDMIYKKHAIDATIILLDQLINHTVKRVLFRAFGLR